VKVNQNTDYFDRLWACLDDYGMMRAPIDLEWGRAKFRWVIVGERWVGTGHLYGQVSELLHGRGESLAAVHAETVHLLARYLSSSEVFTANQQILDIVELCVERIATCTAAALSESGDKALADDLYSFTKISYFSGSEPYPELALLPLLPGKGFLPVCLEFLESGNRVFKNAYEGRLPGGRLFGNGKVSELFFVDRRYSSAKFATEAYEHEAVILGKPVDSLRLDDNAYKINHCHGSPGACIEMVGR
jgi:hypothetical protein